jgi:hypothetical protein
MEAHGLDDVQEHARRYARNCIWLEEALNTSHAVDPDDLRAALAWEREAREAEAKRMAHLEEKSETLPHSSQSGTSCMTSSGIMPGLKHLIAEICSSSLGEDSSLTSKTDNSEETAAANADLHDLCSALLDIDSGIVDAVQTLPETRKRKASPSGGHSDLKEAGRWRKIEADRADIMAEARAWITAGTSKAGRRTLTLKPMAAVRSEMPNASSGAVLATGAQAVNKPSFSNVPLNQGVQELRRAHMMNAHAPATPPSTLNTLSQNIYGNLKAGSPSVTMAMLAMQHMVKQQSSYTTMQSQQQSKIMEQKKPASTPPSQSGIGPSKSETKPYASMSTNSAHMPTASMRADTGVHSLNPSNTDSPAHNAPAHQAAGAAPALSHSHLMSASSSQTARPINNANPTLTTNAGSASTHASIGIHKAINSNPHGNSNANAGGASAQPNAALHKQQGGVSNNITFASSVNPSADMSRSGMHLSSGASLNASTSSTGAFSVSCNSSNPSSTNLTSSMNDAMRAAAARMQGPPQGSSGAVANASNMKTNMDAATRAPGARASGQQGGITTAMAQGAGSHTVASSYNSPANRAPGSSSGANTGVAQGASSGVGSAYNMASARGAGTGGSGTSGFSTGVAQGSNSSNSYGTGTNTHIGGNIGGASTLMPSAQNSNNASVSGLRNNSIAPTGGMQSASAGAHASSIRNSNSTSMTASHSHGNNSSAGSLVRSNSGSNVHIMPSGLLSGVAVHGHSSLHNPSSAASMSMHSNSNSLTSSNNLTTGSKQAPSVSTNNLTSNMSSSLTTGSQLSTQQTQSSMQYGYQYALNTPPQHQAGAGGSSFHTTQQQ